MFDMTFFVEIVPDSSPFRLLAKAANILLDKSLTENWRHVLKMFLPMLELFSNVSDDYFCSGLICWLV